MGVFCFVLVQLPSCAFVRWGLLDIHLCELLLLHPCLSPHRVVSLLFLFLSPFPLPHLNVLPLVRLRLRLASGSEAFHSWLAIVGSRLFEAASISFARSEKWVGQA